MQNLIENLLQKGYDVTVVYIKPQNVTMPCHTHTIDDDFVQAVNDVTKSTDPVESKKKFGLSGLLLFMFIIN